MRPVPPLSARTLAGVGSRRWPPRAARSVPPRGRARGAAYRRDISHSCRSPASAARCSGSIVPAVLSVPNTRLRQPRVQTAWTPPSPSSWMVVWWSMATGSSEANDGAGHRAPHAVERLDLGGYELGQLVDLARLRPGNDVVGPGQADRLHDARQAAERRSHGGRLAGPGLDQNVRGDQVTPT